MNNIFGKYVDNKSFLTKLDTRFKLFAMAVLLIFSFMNFNIIAYSCLFGFVILLTIIGKLSFIPIFKIVKSMWFLIVIILIFNILGADKDSCIYFYNIPIYTSILLDTLYIFMRVFIILLISNLFTSSSKHGEITYALEWYLSPLKIFDVNVNEIALMMSIALRTVPTLFEEMSRITKAQVSRGVDFKYGKYKHKIEGTISVITPLFNSCLQKADDLTDAITVKGYGMGKVSKYRKMRFKIKDILSLIILVGTIGAIIMLNGVLL